jgi:transposase
LSDRPTSYLDEIALAVLDEFDIDVTPRTIANILKRRRWTRKVCKVFAAQRSAPLRAIWRSSCWHWPVDRLCFVDESAASDRTGYRKRGWAPAGVDCTELRTLKAGDRWSVLPALTVNGYLNTPLVKQGSIDKGLFIWWLINRVIPCLSYGSIIVMDNASVHHNLGPLVAQMLADRGMCIKYLPPYSPDYNPIENTFHTLKAWLRRNHDLQAVFPDFRRFIEYACEQAISSNMRGYFRHCFYNVELVEEV